MWPTGSILRFISVTMLKKKIVIEHLWIYIKKIWILLCMSSSGLLAVYLKKQLAIISFSRLTLCACHQECGPRLCRNYHKAGLEYFDCVSMSVCANVATLRHSATKHYMCIAGIKMQVRKEWRMQEVEGPSGPLIFLLGLDNVKIFQWNYQCELELINNLNDLSKVIRWRMACSL